MGTIRDLLRIKPATETKLPAGFKENWIDALTSGRYKQGEGTLYKKVSSTGKEFYCCLGVAAHLCEIGKSHLTHNGSLSDIMTKFQRRLPAGFREDEDLQNQFIAFNDGKDGVNYTFPQIARWIEKYL